MNDPDKYDIQTARLVLATAPDDIEARFVLACAADEEARRKLIGAARKYVNALDRDVVIDPYLHALKVAARELDEAELAGERVLAEMRGRNRWMRGDNR